MDIVLIALLIVLNGVFAMSEMALTASRKARLGALAQAGDHGAESALKLMDEPTTFLSTVQVGITSIGVLNGIVGEAAFADGLATWLQTFNMPEKAAHIAATGLVVTIITFITIIFGELVPKRIGQLYPETVARWVARPMRWLAKFAKPFVRLLAACTQATLKLLRIDTNAARGVTEEEIAASLEEGVDAGLIEAHEHQMVQNVFHLDDRPLTSLMVPRSDVKWLDMTDTVAQAIEKTSHDSHSWYPVCRVGLDDVQGIVSMARLLHARSEASATLDALMQPAMFMPETLSGMELLEQFRSRATRMVFVVDEYGVVQGLMTPRDLLEAITGELKPGAAADAWATPRADGSWLLDGLMPIQELKNRLDIKELPGEDKGRYNTVAGLLMAVSGELPGEGDQIECANWRFEVVDLDGKRIDKVLATAQTNAVQEVI
jgi:putative hemolysin